MANIKSQIKRNRQNLVAAERNKQVRTRVKSATRAFREAVAGGDKDAATAAYHDVARLLDRAASKGVYHKNTAASRKSKMAKSLAKL